MEQSQDVGDLAKALCAFQAQAVEPKKTAQNSHLRNKYATLLDVWNAVRDDLPKHGLSVTQFPGGTDGNVELTTTLLHSSGQWMRSTVGVPAVSQKGLNPVQVLGSNLSYLRRYALLAVLGLSSEDDDGEAARGRSGGNASNDRRAPSRPAANGDALASWRQRLATCSDPAQLAGWFADARRDLDAGQRAELGAALKARAADVGTSLEALMEAA